MDEYPDENEEFELMYGDEFEVLREIGILEFNNRRIQYN